MDHIAELFVIMAGDLRKCGKVRDESQAMSEYLSFCMEHNITPDAIAETPKGAVSKTAT